MYACMYHVYILYNKNLDLVYKVSFPNKIFRQIVFQQISSAILIEFQCHSQVFYIQVFSAFYIG